MIKIIKYFPFLILLYGIYSGYLLWEEREEGLRQEESRIDIIQTKTAKAEKELKQLEKYYANIEESKSKIQIVQEQIDKLQRQLPDAKDDIAILQLIKELATKLNMQNISLQSSKEVPIDFYFKTRYQLKVTGTFLQFLLLLEQIGKSQKLLHIPEISLQLPGIVQRGRFIVLDGAMAIESFRYNKNYKEESKLNAVEGKLSVEQKE